MKFDELTPHEKLYEKAAILGFPELINGYKIIYEHGYKQADIEFNKDIFIEHVGHFDKGENGKIDEGFTQYGPPAIKILIMRKIVDSMTVLRQPSMFDLMKG